MRIMRVQAGSDLEKTARDAFGGENPIGRMVKGFGGDETLKTIVGVVADTRVNGLKEVADMVYLPYWDNPLSLARFFPCAQFAAERRTYC